MRFPGVLFRLGVAAVVVAVGSEVSLAGLETRPRAYVADSDAQQIVVVDLADLSVLDRIDIGVAPSAVVAAADGSLVFVLSSSSGSLLLIDPASDEIVSAVALGPENSSRGLAIAPDGTKIYVGDQSDRRVLVVDRALALSDPPRAVTVSIPVFERPAAIAVSPDGAQAYVSTDGFGVQRNTIAVLDLATKTLAGNVQVGQQPRGTSFTPDGAFAWVSDLGEVFVVDTTTREVVRDIPFGSLEGGSMVANFDVAISRDGGRAFVAGDGIGVFDTSTYQQIDSLQIVGVRSLALDRSGTVLYGASADDGTLTAIDTSTVEVIDSNVVGDDLEGIALVEGPLPTETATPSPTPTATPAPGGGGSGCAASAGGSPFPAVIAAALCALIVRRRKPGVAARSTWRL